ncbi:protein sneaky-like [Watersipora subatra]|uniref:protein sneaky-like n=1 Tax=Watersipora subatra TaxID=2589382 RepID=UPI00355B9E28
MQSNINHEAEVRHKAITKYKKCFQQVLRNQLNAKNQVMAINTYALPEIRYPADIIKWTEEAIKETDIATRKLLTMHGPLHPKSDTTRLYLDRKDGVQTVVKPTKEERLNKIKKDFEDVLSIIDRVVLHVNQALSLSALIIIIQSALYLRKYRNPNAATDDDQYITKRFGQVDQRRKKEGRTTLLPLAPSEKHLITDTRQKGLSTLEKRSLKATLIPLLLTIVGGGLLIATDYILYEVVCFIRRHSGLRIEVNLDTSISVHRLPENDLEFATTSDADTLIDTAVCFPNGSRPDHWISLRIAILYLAVLMTAFFQAYLIRLRHRIANYFFPDVEKMRVQMLYRSLLQQRVVTLYRLQDNISKKDKKKRENVTWIGKLFKKLRCSKGEEKRNCFLCGSKESKKIKLDACTKCNTNFCKACRKVGNHQSTCFCSANQRLSYDDITESDFEEESPRPYTEV